MSDKDHTKFLACLCSVIITGGQCLPVIAETGKNLSSVEIIYSEKQRKENTLSEYGDFSLVSYQTVENSENTEAVLVSDAKQGRCRHFR